MTGKALLALMLIGLTQNGYCGWQDVLKAVADKALEQQRPSEPKASSSVSPQEKAIEQPNSLQSQDTAGSQQQPGQPKAANHDVDMSIFETSPEDPLMKKGMWKDPRTGLIWSRCAIGESWKGSECVGDAKRLTAWSDALVAASELTYGGRKDWRIPTADEVNSIRNCEGRGFIKDSIRNNSCSGVTKPIYAECNEGGSPNIGTNAIFHRYLDKHSGASYVLENPAESGVNGTACFVGSPGGIGYFFPAGLENALVVTGGNVSESYARRLSEAKAIKNGEAADRLKLEQKWKQEAQQRAQERQQKEMAYQDKANAFRKKLKPGDRAYQGLVLEVKGDLVKIQAYGKRCYGGAGTSVANCNPAYIVPDPSTTVGEQWIRRDAISPAK